MSIFDKFKKAKEVPLPMRDKIQTREYFDVLIENNKMRIDKFRNWLKNANDLERISRLSRAMNRVQLSNVTALYSRGDKPSDIKPLVEEQVKKYVDLYDNPEMYVSDLDELSLCILYGIDGTIFAKLSDKIERKEALFDFLKTAGSDKSQELLDDTYQLLWQAAQSDDKTEQNKLLTDYVNNWYRYSRQRDRGWYDSHKKSSADDSNRLIYNGYWAWEVGAVAKILNIPDDNLKEHPNYPYDLVHY